MNAICVKIKFLPLLFVLIVLSNLRAWAAEDLSETDMKNLRVAIDVLVESVAENQAPFGAVIAGPDGVILMRQKNLAMLEHDYTKHAESELASRFCRKYFNDPDFRRKSTLYSSAEPCAMCMFTMFSAGIGRVVYALSEERLYRIFNEYGHWPRIHLSSRKAADYMSTPIVVAGPYLEDEVALIVRHSVEELKRRKAVAAKPGKAPIQ